MRGSEWIPEERRERGLDLCRKLAEEVARIAPRGLDRWDRTLEIVGPPSADYLVALTAWEAEPGPDRVQDVREAWHALLDAWRRAAALYRERGAHR